MSDSKVLIRSGGNPCSHCKMYVGHLMDSREAREMFRGCISIKCTAWSERKSDAPKI